MSFAKTTFCELTPLMLCAVHKTMWFCTLAGNNWSSSLVFIIRIGDNFINYYWSCILKHVADVAFVYCLSLYFLNSLPLSLSSCLKFCFLGGYVVRGCVDISEFNHEKTWRFYSNYSDTILPKMTSSKYGMSFNDDAAMMAILCYWFW